MVRVFVATPDKKAHARLQTVRVHTDDGWAEVRFANEDGLWHVLLGEPVLTRNLTVEFMATHGEGPVHLAELEVYGRDGTARPPLQIDMARRAVSFDPPVWRKKLRTNTAGVAFVEQIDLDGRSKRLLPGTALIGQTGDRLMLVERASWSTCNDHQGSYSLLDTETRVMVPLGDMGGFAGDVFRHTKGLGFAIGRVDGDDTKIQGILLDEQAYERRSTNRLDRREPREVLASWEVADVPLRRADALPVTEPPSGCEPASTATLEALGPHLPKRTDLASDRWTSCSMGTAQLLVSTGGECGKQWHVAVLEPEGELVGLLSGKEAKTHLRLRRIDEETMLVEQWGDKDTPRLLHADSGSLVQVDGTVGLSLRPPSGCRKRCGIEFADLGPGT